MGEIFRRESAEHPEPFTGERLTAAIGGQVQIEHYHRYLFARSLARGADVLDVASGEGYGSALLAQVARSVVGVEYSGPTAHSACVNFPRENLRFLQGDARALPFADACVDLVVSFETIEHFDRQNDFIRELHRVLRPDGCCIISTPDRDIYSPLGSNANSYHVQELSLREFTALLHEQFRHVAILQQRPMHGSALLAETGSAAPPLVIERRGDTHFEACTGLPRASYVVAIASNREIPPLSASLYIDRSDLDTDRLRAEELDARVTYLSGQLEELGHAIAELGQAHIELDNAHATIRALQAEFAQAVLSLQASNERISRTERAHQDAVEHCAAVQQQLDHLSGSFRSFMRGYLPRLYRYIRGSGR